jgi:hypothetical protein
MSRLFFGLAALLSLSAFGTPVRACINDREVAQAEREFKSQYMQPAPSYNPSSQPPEGRGMSLALLGGGTVLLLGAAAVAFGPRKSRRSD